MQIIVSDELARGIGLTAEEGQLELALGLYRDRRVSLGQAAAVAGTSVPSFMKELSVRRIPLNYDVNDLQEDVKTLREAGLL